MYAKNERLPSSLGIVPDKWFLDRSSDSSSVTFAKDKGMWPVKALFDKLRAINAFKRPMDSGICPSSLFPEKSMVLYEVRTFPCSMNRPLYCRSKVSS
ncbi:hypothetical protein BRARA_E01087 [Brassica rapa]|uniref:Uncharacterized protein n=1 Tax=Brassica campestris TaxID=3711 RepID=A0A397Z8Z1_BRACM|nr:hypothetical protein BRARA_E01087 [Brassica rapa]